MQPRWGHTRLNPSVFWGSRFGVCAEGRINANKNPAGTSNAISDLQEHKAGLQNESTHDKTNQRTQTFQSGVGGNRSWELDGFKEVTLAHATAISLAPPKRRHPMTTDVTSKILNPKNTESVYVYGCFFLNFICMEHRLRRKPPLEYVLLWLSY